MWGWLSRSCAPVNQKLRILYTVAWPRSLHGVAGVDIGPDHFTALRAAAMSALRWEKHGASSLIMFSLFTEPRNDPTFYATMLTVMQFRQYCTPQLAFEVLDKLATQPPQRYLPGPCGVFLSRLHAIHWQWEGNGFFIDHQGIRFHLLDMPIQVLRMRLVHAWASAVGHQMSSRAQFSGLGDVDLLCSRHTQTTLSPVEQGLLRVTMNGSFYTRDKQFSSGKYLTKQCPWCGQEDGVFHRTWKCEHFQAERVKVPAAHKKFLLDQPECTYLQGWIIETPEDLAFRKALMTIPDSTADFAPVSKVPDVLHMFTDGSAMFPAQKLLRLASWAVCRAMLPEDTFLPVAAGGVPGLLQTGNDEADRIASAAVQLLPAKVLHAHRALVGVVQLRYAACQTLHRLLVDIGLKVVQEKAATRAKEAEAWEQAQPSAPSDSEEVSLMPWPATLTEPEEHTMGDGIHVLYEWVPKFTGGDDAQPTWVSSYQMFAHFQHVMDHLGYHYNRKTKKYEVITEQLPNVTFLRSAAWFHAMLKSFARVLGLPCTVQSRMPSGTTLKCWQRCMLLQVSPSTIQRVDQLFRVRNITAVKSVHTSFRQCAPFRGSNS
eukprot:s375_g6.t1